MTITLPADTDLTHLYKMFKLAEELAAKHGLSDWTVKPDRAPKRAGQCIPSITTLSFSAPLFAIWPEDECRDTILHEIAHALTPGAGHGAEWKKKCIEIGARPKAGYNSKKLGLPEVPGKWVGTCPKGHKYNMQRRPKRMTGSCGHCSKKFDPANRVIWKENVPSNSQD